MSRMSARWIALLLSPTLALVGGGAGRVAAQTQTPVVPAHEAPSLEPAAMDTLKRMSDLLKNAKSFTFTYRSAHEQVAQTGQMVDFIHLSRVTLVRPNRLRIEVAGDIRNSVLTYDGKIVTFLDPTQKFYSQLDAPGSIDETLTLLMDKFQTSFPVAGVMFADPYEKMKDVARICFKHWLAQSNVLFIIGGKSNNTDIFTTFRAMGDALREHFSTHGPTPLYVVVGRGGPNLIRGMGALQDTVEALGLPYRFFGFDSAISEVVNYAQAVDRWMKAGGREQLAQRLGMRKAA